MSFKEKIYNFRNEIWDLISEEVEEGRTRDDYEDWLEENFNTEKDSV